MWPRPGLDVADFEIFRAFLAGDDAGSIGAGGIFRGQEKVRRDADGLAVVLGEHELRDAVFEDALPDMSGEAGQPIPSLAFQRDAVIDLRARLKAPQDRFAVALLEHDGAAIVGRVCLASAPAIDHQQRIARRNEPAAMAIRLTSQPRSPAFGYPFTRVQADPLMLAVSQNIDSSVRSASSARAGLEQPGAARDRVAGA